MIPVFIVLPASVLYWCMLYSLSMLYSFVHLPVVVFFSMVRFMSMLYSFVHLPVVVFFSMVRFIMAHHHFRPREPVLTMVDEDELPSAPMLADLPDPSSTRLYDWPEEFYIAREQGLIIFDGFPESIVEESNPQPPRPLGSLYPALPESIVEESNRQPPRPLGSLYPAPYDW
jgi:hypothetical protein